MGYYINPRNESKEAFLHQYGVTVTATDIKNFNDFDGYALPVVLVDNGMFTAAGVMFDSRERDCFVTPDHRPKKWYLVDKKFLTPEIVGGKAPWH